MKKEQKKLSIEEQSNILSQFDKGLISEELACRLLGQVSRATLYRKRKKYVHQGRCALEHGNKGHSPKNRLPPEQRKQIVKLLATKYADFQPALVIKYLRRDEGLQVSREYVRRLLCELGPPGQPKPHRTHLLRRRRARFGELIQIDGSPHPWFGQSKPTCSLLLFVDDATSKITAAGFFATETAAGYLRLIKEHIHKYGVPLAFYSDRHGIFHTPNPTQSRQIEHKTQYQRACSQLGIETILAQSAQAKGRVERLNRTLQNRWPKEFALRGITDINKANENMEQFIQEYNDELGLEPVQTHDAHRTVERCELKQIDRICARWTTRTLCPANTPIKSSKY